MDGTLTFIKVWIYLGTTDQTDANRKAGTVWHCQAHLAFILQSLVG